MLNVLDVLLGQGFVISIASTVIAIVAFLFSLRGAHRDRINANSWGTYEAYNRDEVRIGRDVARKVMTQRQNTGFVDHDEYRAYFIVLANGVEEDAAKLRQSLHDLAAFYHQTGVLLQEHLLDWNFTLLMVGPGLEDRWPVMDSLSQIYVNEKISDDFPYGGMYIIFAAYKHWKKQHFAKLRRQFVRTRARVVQGK